MSVKQLMAFIAIAKDDQSIQEKLKAANTADDVVGIAKEYGHEFTSEHMTQLNEEELEGVAGGVNQAEIDEELNKTNPYVVNDWSSMIKWE